MSAFKLAWGWVLVVFGAGLMVGGLGAAVSGAFPAALLLKVLGLSALWTGIRRIREGRALRSIPPDAVLAELCGELAQRRASGASYEELVRHAMRVGLSRSAAEAVVVRVVAQGGA